MTAEYEKNIKFVQMVEKYTFLYDNREQDYAKKEATEKAWQEIGKEFELTGLESKERWKNLRGVFVRHLRLGNSISKPYYLADYMQFARPFVTQKTNILSRKEIPSNNNEDNHQLSLTQSTAGHNPLPNCDTTPSSPPSASNDNASIKLKRARKVEKDNTDTCSRYNKMFLLSLLSDMNQMNGKQRRVFKRKVLSLAQEILDDDSEENESSSSKEERLSNTPDSLRSVVSNPAPNNSKDSAPPPNDTAVSFVTPIKIEDQMEGTVYEQWAARGYVS